MTIGKTSPEHRSVPPAPLPPDPFTNRNGTANSKSKNQPFSRIKQNRVVHGKLGEDYRPSDYDNNMYETLSQVRGNNFTKQKNKMKNGSFRAGRIDANARTGIKFDD